MLNLITNAIDSMAAKEGPRALYVKSEVCHDGDVEISVEDTGTGISPQHIYGYSIPSLQRNPVAWEWGCRSAARLSRPMRDVYG